MHISGSIDMQFCFSVLFFVLLTALVTYWVVNRGRSGAAGRDAYAAEIERLKREEQEG